ncbi:MAG: hypothetical protein EAZ53_06410 [Bacteroidetes bacterium]|nr:MAG: hypothetical protein EAZ53_06410 [Bacteroidota bacterium]
MLQLFFKCSVIKPNDWAFAYQKIESIISNFPVKLLRLESYDGFSRNQDKLHEDLYLDKGTENEQISFYIDWISFSGGKNINFYKNWHKQIEEFEEGHEFDSSKPITWTPNIPFKNDGSLLEANGKSYKSHIEYSGSVSQYTFLAIAIMLENVLPLKVLLVSPENDEHDIQETINWLNGHFNQSFDLPLYFDKKQVLATIFNKYDSKKDIVCRMEHLYRKQYMRNMAFSIENIGYEPSLQFYAEVLSDNNFNTFGFNDVLNPWMAMTQDIEKTLDLIATSKKILLSDPSEYNLKKLEGYNLSELLTKMLNSFILWTPQQREALSHFYTNDEALEKGREDIWDSIFRITGNRVDICPIYASETELFESFMYHDPKNGLLYRNIIDKWILNNQDAYQNFYQKLLETENKHPTKNDENDELTKTQNDANKDEFLQKFKQHEHFFVQQALLANPYYLNIEESIEKLMERLNNMYNSDTHHEFVANLKLMTKEEKVRLINARLKEIRMGHSSHYEFITWIEEELSEKVLDYLCLLLFWKMYNKELAYARFRILWDKTYWDSWRM